MKDKKLNHEMNGKTLLDTNDTRLSGYRNLDPKLKQKRSLWVTFNLKILC